MVKYFIPALFNQICDQFSLILYFFFHCTDFLGRVKRQSSTAVATGKSRLLNSIHNFITISNNYFKNRTTSDGCKEWIWSPQNVLRPTAYPDASKSVLTCIHFIIFFLLILRFIYFKLQKTHFPSLKSKIWKFNTLNFFVTLWLNFFLMNLVVTVMKNRMKSQIEN